jgi:very-short-patch-repair endonuclease
MEKELRQLAERQHGLVNRQQAARFGIDGRALRRRVAAQTWIAVTRRVYRLAGFRPTFEQRCLAAVLDYGAGCVVCREAAASLWQLPAVRAEKIDVLCMRRGSTTLARVHQVAGIPVHHQTIRLAIPVTSAARTLFDLAGVWPQVRLERALDAALHSKIVSTGELHRLLGELGASGRGGIATMRRLLADRGPGYVPPASGLEARFAALIDLAGLPAPRRQVAVKAGGRRRRVDFAYLDVRLFIEIDSDLYHTARLDRLADLDRDLAFRAAGYGRVLRIGEAVIWDEPDRVPGLVVAARAEAAAVL